MPAVVAVEGEASEGAGAKTGNLSCIALIVRLNFNVANILPSRCLVHD